MIGKIQISKVNKESLEFLVFIICKSMRLINGHVINIIYHFLREIYG